LYKEALGSTTDNRRQIKELILALEDELEDNKDLGYYQKLVLNGQI